MENRFIIGTFYTKETPYEDVFAKFFLPSVMDLAFKHGVEWKVVVKDNLGSWIKNVAQKPLAILEMLETMRHQGSEKALVFVDSDAVFEKYPTLFNEIPDNFDIAFHYLNWDTWYHNNTGKMELLSGTIFFRNNQKVRGVVSEWHKLAVKTDRWEQQVLQEVIEKSNLTIYELPVEYCYIKTMPNGSKPFVTCEPVVSHHQVSRALKKVIK